MLPEIIKDARYRPRGTYMFKVVGIDGQHVKVQKLDGTVDCIKLNIHENELSKIYNELSDSMYVSVDMDGIARLINDLNIVGKYSTI